MTMGGHGLNHILPNVIRINESNPPDGKKRLDISHNQPGIGFFEISVICKIRQKSECVALCLPMVSITCSCANDDTAVIIIAINIVMCFFIF